MSRLNREFKDTEARRVARAANWMLFRLGGMKISPWNLLYWVSPSTITLIWKLNDVLVELQKAIIKDRDTKLAELKARAQNPIHK